MPHLVISYSLPSDIVLGSNWLIPCQPVPIDEPPFFSRPLPNAIQSLHPPHSWQATNGLSQLQLLSTFSLLIPSLVTLELAHLMGSSSSRACDALTSFLGSCCTDLTFCNDLSMNHNIGTHCQASKEQRDAVLRHVLNGLCILKPSVVSCKSFGCDRASSPLR